MKWFRQSDLAEMERELEGKSFTQLLFKISEREGNPFQAISWSDWMKRWRVCPSEEKDRLLHTIFAAYRESPEPEWWLIWLLIFKEKLFGLFLYFKQRVVDQDERWSLIVWSFLEVLTRQKDDASRTPTVDGICKCVKYVINKNLYEERKIKKLEVRLPEHDLRQDDNGKPEPESLEEQRFASLCRNVRLFFDDLSPMDRIIIEEIYLLGHPGQFCARRLGISRDQVNRRLARIKGDISIFLRLSITQRIRKT